MTPLVEFHVNKSIWNNVKNDPEQRVGFEAEFHVRNAVDLLRDESGDLPGDFYSFNVVPDMSDIKPITPDNASIGGENEPHFYIETVMLRLAELFSSYLGLPVEDISTDPVIYHSNYQRWRLVADASLRDNEETDLGVELISPVMNMKDGLVWISKVLDMIANFNHGEIFTETSELCGFHVNLSHIRMGVDFDFAKLAILSGDQHYLKDFERLGNHYSAPIMQAVYDQLIAVKQHEAPSAKQENALRLLNLRGWSPKRVMSDLAALIPMYHYMSVDLSRLDSLNPYIEIRIAGNAGYELRFDEIAALAIRFGALIKIGCDPWAYREEYLKKIYQLVSGVIAAPEKLQKENPFPRIHIYLSPIMSTVTRSALNQLETLWRRQTLTVQNSAYLFLSVMRSAMDLQQLQSPRVRQGMHSLMTNVLKLTPKDLLKVLRNNVMLAKYGIVRPNEKVLQIVTGLTNAINMLDKPVTRRAIMTDAYERMQREEDRLLAERRKKRKLAEQQEREAKRKALRELRERQEAALRRILAA